MINNLINHDNDIAPSAIITIVDPISKCVLGKIWNEVVQPNITEKEAEIFSLIHDTYSKISPGF